MFSVSLPTASQNSLLVVQSTSPVVRAQFAGWFVYAMSGEGYNVNAEIMNITTKACPPACLLACVSAVYAMSGEGYNVKAEIMNITTKASTCTWRVQTSMSACKLLRVASCMR